MSKPDHEHGQWHPEHGHGIHLRPNKVEVQCPGCMVVIDILFNEKRHEVVCPCCKRVMEVWGREVTG